jgi:amino-acid N-acetyltransferase
MEKTVITSQQKDDMNLLRQGFSYAHRYRNTIFVIKIDGKVIGHPNFPLLIKDIALLHQIGIRIILVPGARERIDEVIAQYGFSTEYRNSVRITTEQTIPFARMAAFDISNRLMTGLAGHGINAVVGNWVRAKSMGVIDGIDFQFTGTIERLLTEPVRDVISMGMVPIFPCIGWNATGKPYNISSDLLAVEIAIALCAGKLFFITSEDHMSNDKYQCPELCGVSREGKISRIDASTAASFLEMNKEKEEELFRVKLAHRACSRDVDRVHILDGRIEGALLQEIFSNQGLGTMIHTNLYESIRDMTSSDVSDVLRIMDPYIEEGILVARDKQSLLHLYHDFVVFDVDGIVHGCAALHQHGDDQAEIAAVAVDSRYRGSGIGRRMVSYLVSKARERGLKQIFVLTTRTADWFEQMGFQRADISAIPEKRRITYNIDRNSVVLVYPLRK